MIHSMRDLPTQSVGTILAAHSLSYLYSPTRFLTEASRVLAHGGRLLLAVPGPSYCRGQDIAYRLGGRRVPFWQKWTADGLRKNIIDACGLHTLIVTRVQGLRRADAAGRLHTGKSLPELLDEVMQDFCDPDAAAWADACQYLCAEAVKRERA